jgi:uncharacterized protein (DUF58 family)
MLRETEEPSRTEVIVILDGTGEAVTGELPDTSFEASVAAAGSVADFVLREGFGVGLLLHGSGGGATFDHFDGRERGHRELLRALAGARAEAKGTLAETVRRQEAIVSRGLALVVISSSFERTLLVLLTELRERNLPVYLVHVDGPSFARAEMPDPVRTEQRRFLLGLQAAGVLSVTLRRGDEGEDVLSFGPGVRAAAGGASGPVLGRGEFAARPAGMGATT